MLDPGRHSLEPGLPRQRHHLLWQRGGGEIDLGHGSPSKVLRTAPPTARVSTPGAASAANTRPVWGRFQPLGILKRRGRGGAR